MTAPLAPRAPRRHSLSVCLICRDEADRIDACLASVAGWADEIVVFDGGSHDDTAERARRYTDRVWVTDWPGYGVQRQRTVEAARGAMLLVLDADEQLSPELRAEIDAVLAVETAADTAYGIRWQLRLFGKPLRFAGRYGAAQTRLFPRDKVRFPPAPVHESPVLATTHRAQLRERLLHDSYRDYRALAAKHLDYGWLLARQKHAAGKQATVPGALLRAAWEFLLQYLLRGMLLEGQRGLLLALTLAQYAFHKQAGLYALRAAGAARETEFDPRRSRA